MWSMPHILAFCNCRVLHPLKESLVCLKRPTLAYKSRPCQRYLLQAAAFVLQQESAARNISVCSCSKFCFCSILLELLSLLLLFLFLCIKRVKLTHKLTSNLAAPRLGDCWTNAEFTTSERPWTFCHTWTALTFHTKTSHDSSTDSSIKQNCENIHETKCPHPQTPLNVTLRNKLNMKKTYP